jgi:DNA replicative helicase MCM subunit Mcm2 (Cdc46/Mcm family)
LEQDLALSRHVLHVHKHLKKPDSTFQPLPPSAVKQYIAAARTVNLFASTSLQLLYHPEIQLEPEIPVELTTYIVENYVTMRLMTWLYCPILASLMFSQAERL